MSNNRGFTLIELLVTMSIMGIMTTLAFVNFRSAEYGDELRYAAQNLAAEIRRAQTFALVNKTVHYCSQPLTASGDLCPSGEDSDCGTNGKCIFGSPKGGYGLQINSSSNGGSSMFFVDTGGAGHSGNIDHRYQSFEAQRILDFTVGQNVAISDVDPNDGNGKLDIVFVPPRPTAWFNGTNDPIANITLTHDRTDNSTTIRINGISGQVSIH